MKLGIYYGFYIFFVFSQVQLAKVDADLNDYIKRVGQYLWYNEEKNDVEDEEFTRRIPYEVAATDEKFISEAAKLTGIALSELDSCQHRVILKLKMDCHKLNDEQLAKLAVQLLNCQSHVEGRKTYPCSEDMSIKDCTTNMDSDTWTSYHLMSNRARAVCYMIRQTQFRGLAENTVNRLMDAAKNQLHTLDKIALNQENLKDVADLTLNTLSQGHHILTQQQRDIQHAQFRGQLTLEQNIGRLVDEKRIIAETHDKLLSMAQDVQNKLENYDIHVENQVGESKMNHQELIADLLKIQDQTNSIFSKIEESSKLLIQQNEDFSTRYEYTLRNLAELNRTVHHLVSIVGGTRKALEARLVWITNALGGTDLAVERLYLILWHVAFVLSAMLACAFLVAGSGTRLAVTVMPSLNLIVGLYGDGVHLDPLGLSVGVLVFVLVQAVVEWVSNYRGNRHAIRPILALEKPTANVDEERAPKGKPIDIYEDENDRSPSGSVSSRSPYARQERNGRVGGEEFGAPTPPVSRNGYYSPRSRSNTPSNLLNGRNSCNATTRLGTPCKLHVLPGRDYCYRHQSGDSVFIK